MQTETGQHVKIKSKQTAGEPKSQKSLDKVEQLISITYQKEQISGIGNLESVLR